jgi:hypothetical protein
MDCAAERPRFAPDDVSGIYREESPAVVHTSRAFRAIVRADHLPGVEGAFFIYGEGEGFICKTPVPQLRGRWRRLNTLTARCYCASHGVSFRSSVTVMPFSKWTFSAPAITVFTKEVSDSGSGVVPSKAST